MTFSDNVINQVLRGRRQNQPGHAVHGHHCEAHGQQAPARPASGTTRPAAASTSGRVLAYWRPCSICPPPLGYSYHLQMHFLPLSVTQYRDGSTPSPGAARHTLRQRGRGHKLGLVLSSPPLGIGARLSVAGSRRDPTSLAVGETYGNRPPKAFDPTPEGSNSTPSRSLRYLTFAFSSVGFTYG